jgi:KDO2-lipid IV(A) lauroyltransferase
MQAIALFFIKLLTRAIGAIPFKGLQGLSQGLAFVFIHLFTYRKSVVLANLGNAFPEHSPAQTASIARRFYRHLADVILESIKGLTLPKAELQRRFRYRNPEIFDDLFSQGKSAILLGSHYGNWEWGVVTFPLAVRHKVVGIYKPLGNPLTDRWLNRLRCRWGLQLASMQQAGRTVAEHKNQPCIFVLIADQTPLRVRNAHWVRFLSRDTPFLPGPDRLTRQTGYPVFIFDIERMEQGFYEVTFTELCANPAGLPEGEITGRFARHLENTIRRKPEDWLWSHRRWKRAKRIAEG